MFDRVIQEVCDSSQVDFEESGVDQQTLIDLRKVRCLSVQSVCCCVEIPCAPDIDGAAKLQRPGRGRPAWESPALEAPFYSRLVPPAACAFLRLGFLPPPLARSVELLFCLFNCSFSAVLSFLFFFYLFFLKVLLVSYNNK